MPLSPGDQLGPYVILSAIGAGGMGEVYKARDPRLDRIVAIKVSKTAFSERFEREAKAIAQLNHPHICQIYDVGPNYLVMEYVEGTQLKGPLPLEKALEYAGQIAGALDAAHSKKITHRDLKPANILVTKSAGVKLLDFGLAKIEKAVTVDDETMTMGLTAKGTILGTLLYMSPEQIQGKEADARSDIFSFGLVLYEILTGKRAFEGESPASVMGAILERPAPVFEPEGMHRLVATCLAKDPDQRFQNARDLKRAIEWSTSAPLPVATPVPKPPSRPWLTWAAAAILAALAVAGWMRSPKNGPAGLPDLTLTISPPVATGIALNGSPMSAPYISPDGSAVIFRDAANASHLRRLDSLTTERLSLPSGAGQSGLWSPDGRSFMADSDGEMWELRMPGGAPKLVTKIGGPGMGVSRAASGDLVFATVRTQTSLFVVSGEGAEPKQIQLPGLAEGGYHWPEFIPGTNDFLVTLDSTEDDADIYLATLKDGKPSDPVLLMRNKTAPHFTPARGGQLLFVRDNVLYAQKINLGARRLEGEPEAVVSGVSSVPELRMASFSVSANGVIAWRPGKDASAQLITFDRSGKQIGTSGPASQIFSVKLSPDEQHLLVSGSAGQRVVEPGLSGQLTIRRTRTGLTTIWASDNRRFLIPEPGRVLERPVSGGEERELIKVPGLDRLEDITPDGKIVLFTHGALASEVFAASLDGSTPPRSVVKTGEQIYDTRFSPDARWIVYEAYPQGKSVGGIYVQPFPGPGLRRQIAPSGRFPVWRKDGKEIVFLSASQNEVWSIAVSPAGTDLAFSAPKMLFPVRPPGGVIDITLLAVTRDGSRIYLPQPVPQPDTDVIHVRTGWGSK